MMADGPFYFCFEPWIVSIYIDEASYPSSHFSIYLVSLSPYYINYKWQDPWTGKFPCRMQMITNCALCLFFSCSRMKVFDNFFFINQHINAQMLSFQGAKMDVVLENWCELRRYGRGRGTQGHLTQAVGLPRIWTSSLHRHEPSTCYVQCTVLSHRDGPDTGPVISPVGWGQRGPGRPVQVKSWMTEAVGGSQDFLYAGKPVTEMGTTICSVQGQQSMPR